MSDQPHEGATDDRDASGRRLFDLRWVIGGLFVVYGVVLTVVGLLDSGTALHKASGVRINLWTGIGMLLVGAFFVAWCLLRPLRRPD